MTEREQLIAWLDRVGLTYWWKGNDVITGDVYFERDIADWNAVRGDKYKTVGYSGFFTKFKFDINGDLIEAGAWE